MLSIFVNGWSTYFNHKVFFASLGMSALWATAIDWGVLILTYLSWSGMDMSVLAICRGSGALLGVFGTFIYPFLNRKMSIEKIAFRSIWV